jgi:hypothetical protein
MRILCDSLGLQHQTMAVQDLREYVQANTQTGMLASSFSLEDNCLMRVWKDKSTLRPTFSQTQAHSLLELLYRDSLRSHFRGIDSKPPQLEALVTGILRPMFALCKDADDLPALNLSALLGKGSHNPQPDTMKEKADVRLTKQQFSSVIGTLVQFAVRYPSVTWGLELHSLLTQPNSPADYLSSAHDISHTSPQSQSVARSSTATSSSSSSSSSGVQSTRQRAHKYVPKRMYADMIQMSALRGDIYGALEVLRYAAHEHSRKARVLSGYQVDQALHRFVTEIYYYTSVGDLVTKQCV